MLRGTEPALRHAIGTLVVSCALSQPLSARVPPAGDTPFSAASADPQAQVGTATRSSEAYYQFMLGRHLASEGDIEAAIKAFRQAAAADPRSAEIPAELALLYAGEDQVSEARSAAEEALKLDPASVEAHRVLGTVYASLSRFEDPAAASDPAAARYAADAITHLEAAGRVTARLPDPSAQVLLSRLYAATRQHAKAIPVLESLLQDEPGLPQAVALLADAYENTGRTGDAVALMTDTAQYDPRFYLPLAELYERGQQWKNAADAYERAVDLFPRRSDLRTRWATALLSIPGDAGAARAREVLSAVVADSPADARALYLLAQAERALNNQDAAEASARRLLDLRPGDAASHAFLAELYVSGRKYDDALKVIGDALQRFPGDLTLIFQQGAAFERAGRYEEAEAAFRRVIAGDPQHALALNYLGYMMADRGVRLDEAVDLIKRALAVEPGNAAYLDSLGWAYFRQNKLDLAEPNLQAAAAANARDSAIQEHYGDLLEKLGRYDEAIRAWEKALAGDSEQVDRSGIQKKIKSATGKMKPR